MAKIVIPEIVGASLVRAGSGRMLEGLHAVGASGEAGPGEESPCVSEKLSLLRFHPWELLLW